MQKRASRVLVAESDPAVAEVVARYLEREGHEVECVDDGVEALDRASADPPDLIILDLVLSGLDGLQVCRRVREQLPVPVIMITTLGQEIDRVADLETGADDYITKPFSPRELALRVQSVLRRARGGSAAADDRRPARTTRSGQGARGALASASHAPTPAGTTALRDGELIVEPGTRQAWLADREITLTAREFDLLVYLLRNPRQAFSRAELLNRVWGWSFGDSSTVTVHVRRLREKIEPNPTDPKRIVTVWGVGYRYEPLP
ncbi:response regulator transcription factor [Sphaerimonospora sp. CA-214678]|uniref:response regulator transcription factor n=1 Tax=Sphaerimonospora sp. CA-214678 TaxID=3240029 RepID=UPI003D939992